MIEPYVGEGSCWYNSNREQLPRRAEPRVSEAVNVNSQGTPFSVSLPLLAPTSTPGWSSVYLSGFDSVQGLHSCS